MAIATLRVPFDLSAPFVVSTADGIVAGVGEKMRRYASGAYFPWRELGMSELDIATLWNAGKVDCVDRDASLDELVKLTEEYGGYDEPVLAEPAESRRAIEVTPVAGADDSRIAVMTIHPGETISVETPTQREARRKRR